jgi:hypothetical protein
MSDLDRAAAHLKRSIKAARLAQFHGKKSLGSSAVEMVGKEAAEEGEKAMGFLLAAGASLDKRPASARLDDAIPLHLLDTDNARRLLLALRDVLPLAEAVDKERGRVVAPEMAAQLLPGDTPGMDLAESVNTLILRLRTEIHGPQTGRE